MYADAALVVRRSPAEQPVAPAGRLETGELPDGGVTDGLYVVVRVQAHARRSSRALEAAKDRRLERLACACTRTTTYSPSVTPPSGRTPVSRRPAGVTGCSAGERRTTRAASAYISLRSALSLATSPWASPSSSRARRRSAHPASARSSPHTPSSSAPTRT